MIPLIRAVRVPGALLSRHCAVSFPYERHTFRIAAVGGASARACRAFGRAWAVELGFSPACHRPVARRAS
jgi:hypothetical protein